MDTYTMESIYNLYNLLVENCEMFPELKIKSKTQVEVQVELKDLGFTEIKEHDNS